MSSTSARAASNDVELAVLLCGEGRYTEAARVLREVVGRRGESWELLFNLAIAEQSAGELEEAVRTYRRCLSLNPGSAEAYNNLGTVLERLARYEEAIDCFRSALITKPEYVRPLVNLGKVLRQLGRAEESVASLEGALARSPDNPLALTNYGFALSDLGRTEQAAQSFARAIARSPQIAEAHLGLGRLRFDAGDTSAAITSLNRAVTLKSDLTEAHVLLGRVGLKTGQGMKAAACFERALQINPNIVEAHHLLGVALLYTKGDAIAALPHFERAITLNPAFVPAHVFRAQALTMLQRLPEALATLERALALHPDDINVLSEELTASLRACEWPRAERALDQLRALPNGTDTTHPFRLMAVWDDPAAHARAASYQAQLSGVDRVAMPARGPGRSSDRIRLAYVSGDFYSHATSYLVTELLELHDRSAFEVLGVSFSPDDRSALRGRALGAFDEVFDALHRTEWETAQWMRERQVDIAIDLKGYTAFARPGIFAYRPAPLQVSYLGYPGTMSAPFIDYLLADSFLIPPAERAFYSEQIVCLPNSYQVNDRQRPLPAETPSRAAAGLPDSGFVFCCFNNSWKIIPTVFEVWMHLLQALDGSVLWLLEDNATATENLRREAHRRGIVPERIVACPRLPHEQHLARHALADLFLDTFPCNAHTTASDALWSGLPVVTCAGRSFASRVAGSLLRAADLGELVTSSLDEYQALALRLARDPDRLRAMREHLMRNRTMLPLFDAPRTCRHLEVAYDRMWRAHLEGRAPEDFTVPRVEP